MNDSQARLETIRSLSEFKAHEQAYREFSSLLPASKRLGFNFDWVVAHHALFTRGNTEMFFIFLWSENKIMAIAPFQREIKDAKKLYFKRLQFWGSGPSFSHNNPPDFLLRPEADPHFCVDRLINYLYTDLVKDWDEMYFTSLVLKNSLINLIKDRFRKRVVESQGHNTYQFHAPGTIDDLVKGESRRKIKKARENMAKDFNSFSFNCYNTMTDSVFDEITDLHTNRQEVVNSVRTGRDYIFQDPMERDAIRAGIQVAEDNGGLRLYTLEIDNKIVSFLLCYYCEKWTQAFITAFDIQYRRYQASRSLWSYAYTMEREEFNSDCVDLGLGSNQFKVTFSNYHEALYTLREVNAARFASRFKCGILQLLKRVKKIVGK